MRSLMVRAREVEVRPALVGLVVVTTLIGAGCAREPEGMPFLSRPAPTAGEPLRLAFTARGRVWIAEPDPASGQGEEEWTVAGVPGRGHQDRPVWMPGGRRLALSVWFDEHQADLAIYEAGELTRLTATGDDEFLDDVAPDGRLLFERGGNLLETTVIREREAGGSRYRAGEEHLLTSGRDGRYTPSGRLVIFVRGHSCEPLGLWRRGYSGGDDSEIFLLDLSSLEVAKLTDNLDNDELPVPLDDAGRRFIACRERGGPYQPWLVEAVAPRIQRVRRIRMPVGHWPVVFPAVRHGEGGSFEVWAEADGRLYRAAVAVADTGLAFSSAVKVPVRLPRDAGAGDGGENAAARGRLFDEITGRLLGGSPWVADRWHRFPEEDRERFQSEFVRAGSSRASQDVLARMFGRLAVPGLYYVPEGQEADIECAPPPANQAELARALADSGLAYLRVAGLGDELAPRLVALAGEAPRALVLDLRGSRSSLPVDAVLLLLCDVPRGGNRSEEAIRVVGTTRFNQPVVGFIDSETCGDAEIIADQLRNFDGCRLIGRPTAGLVMPTERHPLEAGGTLVVPVPERIRPRVSEGVSSRGLVPQVFVSEHDDPASEPWLEEALAAARELEPRAQGP